MQEHAAEHSSNKRLLDFAMMRGCKYSAGNLFVQHSLANLYCPVLATKVNGHVSRHAPVIVAMVVLPVVFAVVVQLLTVVVI